MIAHRPVADDDFNGATLYYCLIPHCRRYVLQDHHLPGTNQNPGHRVLPRTMVGIAARDLMRDSMAQAWRAHGGGGPGGGPGRGAWSRTGDDAADQLVRVDELGGDAPPPHVPAAPTASTLQRH